MALKAAGVGITVRVDGQMLVSLAPDKGLATELGMELVEALMDVMFKDGGDENVFAAAIAVSGDVDPALVEYEDHTDHDGDDEDATAAAAADEVEVTLEDVCAVAATVSRDADVKETVLEVQLVSLPYCRR
jgi:hypothetical protein